MTTEEKEFIEKAKQTEVNKEIDYFGETLIVVENSKDVVIFDKDYVYIVNDEICKMK